MIGVYDRYRAKEREKDVEREKERDIQRGAPKHAVEQALALAFGNGDDGIRRDLAQINKLDGTYHTNCWQIEMYACIFI